MSAGRGHGRGPAAQPEPLPAGAFDSHCHLDLIERPVGEIVAEASAVGVARMITVGCDLPSSRWAAGCAADNAGVYAAVAIHPNETTAAAAEPGGSAAVLAEVAALAALPQVRAVGETGLDYYRDSSEPSVQRDWFRGHIEIAKATGKALMIHDREAHEDVLRLLAADGAPERVVFHCFSGDRAMARLCAQAGYVMSFAGNVTFASAQRLRDAAEVAPAELILVETDAPFLTPVPHRGKPNTPAMVAHTVRRIAEVKRLGLEELCAAIAVTGERVFGPWQD